MPTVLRVAAHVPRQNYVHHLLRPTMQRVLALQMPLEAIELVPTSHDVLHVHYCRIGMGPPAGGGRILANIRGHVSQRAVSDVTYHIQRMFRPERPLSSTGGELAPFSEN